MRYADHADGFGDLSLPTAPESDGGWPIVVLIHGGFWRDGFFLDLMSPLVPSLTERGIAVWNLEYRRVGAGGGFPATFEDIADAIDHLAVLAEHHPGLLDLDRVATVGHSAGGQLATWAASRAVLPADTVGASPRVRPVSAVSQAGVVDLVDGADRSVGRTACADLLGGRPDEVADRYGQTSPIELLPIPATVVLVHGALDDTVPLRQSERYAAAARRVGASVELVVDETAGHYEHLDPDHAVWSAVLGALDAAGISG